MPEGVVPVLMHCVRCRRPQNVYRSWQDQDAAGKPVLRGQYPACGASLTAVQTATPSKAAAR